MEHVGWGSVPLISRVRKTSRLETWKIQVTEWDRLYESLNAIVLGPVSCPPLDPSTLSLFLESLPKFS